MMRLKGYILLIVLPLLSLVAFGQKDDVQLIRYIDSTLYVHKIDILKTEFQDVSGIPDRYATAFYTALSYYPELRNSHIRVKTGNIKTTLSMRPTIWSVIFKPKHNRDYILRINKDNNFGNIILRDVNYQAAVGLFGHELAHILDYRSVGAGGILKRAVWYLSEEKRTFYEHQIDMLTIDKGLGWQLYEWSRFVQQSPKATPQYKRLKARRYLKPPQILSTMNQD
ncbi:hypothetical protein [Saccharicrinis sp. FJH65]|uniref:hypothetical protein n=1 Tax=Saccharicrinis sp. FJH65 TaxID=3344659 RepID=UPI0036D43D2D